MKGKQLLTDFIKKHKWSYITGLIILIATTMINMTIPKLLGIITDGLNNKNMPQQQMVRYVLLMLGVAVAVFVFRFLWRYLLIGNCRSVEVYLRDNLFKHMQTLPVSFYSDNKTGNLVAYAINDVQAVRLVFGVGSIQILNGLLSSVISIFFMAKTIDPGLTLIALAPVPVAVLIMVTVGRLIRERFKKVQEAFAAISEKVQENIAGIRVIKAFAQEKEEVDNFMKISRRRVDTQMKLTKVSALLGPCAQICFGVGFLFFIVYGSRQVIEGEITLGDYVAFNSYMTIIMGPIMMISRIIDVWQRGVASYKRLREIFDTPSAAGRNSGETDISGVKWNLEVKNLNFTYPGAARRALKNINFKLENGKTLGIIGRTGSGKTTLVNLLLKLYDVDDGHIFFDRTDINNIPTDVLRESIGYVPQDNFLFSTTIKNNIEFFRTVYSDYEIEQAARMSGVYDNIVSFPEGFSTVVGERGVTLSGGQKQRISIARALVKNPGMLIMDDSLSAVDTKTEEEILDNIRELLRSKTGILISHRVSTVKHADEILFMDSGKIVERGTHEQLIKLGGHYYNLFRAQTDEEVEAV